MSPAERCTPERVRGATSFLSTIGKGVHPEGLGDDGRQIGQFCQLLGGGISAQHVDGGSAISSFDCFAEALSLAETVGSTITAFVASPTNVLAVSTLKVAATHNQPLLGVDPSSPTKRSLFGVPLYSSSSVDDDVVWAIPQAKTFVVTRLPASSVTDSSAFFSSERTAVRCTTRISFGYSHASAIVRIDLGGS
jgi:hypothetical protein